MAEYHFTGRLESGKYVKGQRIGTLEEVAFELQKEGIVPIQIEPTVAPNVPTPKARARVWIRRKSPVSVEERLMFCRQMYSLIKAGIPIITAITLIAQTTRTKEFTGVLLSLVQKLNEGRSLAFALSLYPRVFSPLFAGLVSVGEKIGKLEDVFLELAQYLSLEEKTEKRVKTAFRYPIIVISAVFVAMFVINVMVIPAFAKMFERFGADLPWPTQVLIAVSHFVTHDWYILLGGIFLGVLGIGWVLHTPVGKRRWGKWQLKIPILGWIIHRIYLARFSRVFALILAGGIPALEGIELVAHAIGNAWLEENILKMRDLVGQGTSISKAAKQVHLFSPLVLQMLALGEETGEFERMLTEVADFYEREIEFDLARLSDAMEPILIMMLGGMVLILALGVFLPMWDLINLARHG